MKDFHFGYKQKFLGKTLTSTIRTFTFYSAASYYNSSTGAPVSRF
jgi:hypothetical protein